MALTVEEMKSVVDQTDLAKLREKLKIADRRWRANLAEFIKDKLNESEYDTFNTATVHNILHGAVRNVNRVYTFISMALLFIESKEVATAEILQNAGFQFKKVEDEKEQVA